jgi:hypothetical protein
MAESPGKSATISCPICGFENTTTSLYCQDCGGRLVAPPSAMTEQADPAETAAIIPNTRTKARILTVQRPRRVRGFFIITVRTLVLAALAALLIQILRPPADLPPADPPLSGDVVVNVRAALNRSAMNGKAFAAPWFGEGLNAYLAAVVPPTDSGSLLHVAFVRAALSPADDGFALFVQRKFAGVTFYSRTDYHLVTRGSGIGIVRTGAAIGHLPLPAWAAPAMDSMGSGIAQALSPEIGLLHGARGVLITPQKVTVEFGSSSP